MGGLNPGIILSIGQNAQQQQPPNLLGQYQAIQQIQANKLAMQAQQQNYQTAGIKQQEAQMALQQQQLAAKQQQDMVALIQQSGGDVRKAIQQGKAQGNQQAFVLEKNQDEAEQLVTKTKKDAEDAAKAHFETQQKGLDRIGSMAASVLNASPEMQGIAYQGVRSQAQALGIPGADQLPPAWDENAKAALLNIQQGSIAAADQNKQKLEAAKAAQQAKHDDALESQAKESEQNLNAYRGAEVQNMNAARQLEAKRIGIAGMNAQTERASLGLRQAEFAQNYGDAAGNVSPGNLKLAEKLSQGELDPSMLGRMPGKQGIMAAAMQMNPNWTPQLYQTKKDFKTGKSADDLTRLQTALEHAQRFADNSGKMGTLESLTSGANLTGNQRKLSLDANLLSGEVGRLVTGGVVPEGELHQIQSNLKSGSASVRKQAAEELMQLAAGKIEGLRKRYENGTGMKFDNSLLTPQAQALANSGAAAGSGAAPGVTAAPGVPSVGAMFNGEKVLKVTRVK
jgi:hypothetical protein